MKYLIDKAAFDALDPALQALYTQKGEDYVLAVEGLPEPEDTTGLKANRDQILADLKAAKARAKELEDAARDSQTEAARKAGDIEALQNSWQQKYDQAVSQGQSSVESLQAQIHSLTVGAAASGIAGELAVQGSASVLRRLIEPRLSMEMRDGQPTVVVLDNDGHPTALTLAEFKTEITSDAALAPLVAASRATGGGAPGSKSPGGKTQLSDMSESERKQLAKDNPAQFAKLVEQARSKE
jgi:hypothetical protein